MSYNTDDAKQATPVEMLLIISTLIYFAFAFIFRIIKELLPDTLKGGIAVAKPTVFSILFLILGLVGIIGSIYLLLLFSYV